MSDVTETLQDLMERRLNEMGKRRGRGESISLREAYQRMVEQLEKDAADGSVIPDPVPTYEVFRRIRKGHTKITDPTAAALATMLDVPVDQVYAAAKIRPRLGRFELPTRADRLNDHQRKIVLSVVDAILEASTTDSDDRKPLVVDHVRPKGADISSAPNLVILHQVEQVAQIAQNVGRELGRLGEKVPDQMVRVAVRKALDPETHPELYEDVAARPSTK